jgi:hypothetical protein
VVLLPSKSRPPAWVDHFVSAVAAERLTIDSRAASGLKSDIVLSALAPALLAQGYTVETSKKATDQIRRPVLFGEQGEERVAYHVDAFHEELGIAVEIEAGRGARGNAVYRDLIRSSLLVDARYLALGVMSAYHHQSSGRRVVVESYRDARDQIDAIYASGRLILPFDGLLLFGY